MGMTEPFTSGSCPGAWSCPGAGCSPTPPAWGPGEREGERGSQTPFCTSPWSFPPCRQAEKPPAPSHGQGHPVPRSRSMPHHLTMPVRFSLQTRSRFEAKFTGFETIPSSGPLQRLFLSNLREIPKEPFSPAQGAFVPLPPRDHSLPVPYNSFPPKNP